MKLTSLKISTALVALLVAAPVFASKKTLIEDQPSAKKAGTTTPKAKKINLRSKPSTGLDLTAAPFTRNPKLPILDPADAVADDRDDSEDSSSDSESPVPSPVKTTKTTKKTKAHSSFDEDESSSSGSSSDDSSSESDDDSEEIRKQAEALKQEKIRKQAEALKQEKIKKQAEALKQEKIKKQAEAKKQQEEAEAKKEETSVATPTPEQIAYEALMKKQEAKGITPVLTTTRESKAQSSSKPAEKKAASTSEKKTAPVSTVVTIEEDSSVPVKLTAEQSQYEALLALQSKKGIVPVVTTTSEPKAQSSSKPAEKKIDNSTSQKKTATVPTVKTVEKDSSVPVKLTAEQSQYEALLALQSKKGIVPVVTTTSEPKTQPSSKPAEKTTSTSASVSLTRVAQNIRTYLESVNAPEDVILEAIKEATKQ